MSVARFDVAIVGAGPAGSAAATSLARKGYSVVLLDKALFPREKLCGDFLSPINWRIFEQLGVAEELLSLEHEKITSFRISVSSGEHATIGFPFRNGRRLFGLGMRRFFLDDLLLRAAEKQGVVIRQGFQVRGIVREQGGWSLSLDGAFPESRVQSVFLIGADGRNSLVAHRLGLARKRESSENHLAFQARLNGVKGLKGDVQIHGFPGGYAGLVGLGGGTANLCFVVEKKKAKGAASPEALWEHCLCRNPHLRESLRQGEIVSRVRSAFPVYFSPRRSYGDGFLLAGDAARVTEPVTGEGVFFALKSGMLSAEGIDSAFRKRNGSLEPFASYDRLCREAFSLRQGVNRIIRALVYHPSLLSPVVRLSAKTSFPLRALVHWLCRAV